MFRGLVLGFIFLTASSVVSGQEQAGVKFNIQVKHKGRSYPSAVVKVFKNGSFYDQIPVNTEGEFSYLMPYNFVYQLHFTGDGMVTKNLELDLISNVPEAQKNGVYDWSIGEIELFKAYKEIDLNELVAPVARIHFEPDIAELSIDYKFTGKRKKELAKIEQQVEKFEKEEAILEKANKKEYATLVEQGNKALNDKQFEEAKEYFQQAINIQEEGEAKQKLLAIDKVLKRENDFKSLLAEAKLLKEKGELQQATEKYIAASALKPEDALPKEQIALLAQEIKAEEQKANSFNNYMAVANRAFAGGNYEAAAANFNKALSINPDAQLALRKLELSELRLKEQNEKAAADEKFNNLLVDAKNARVRGDLGEAEQFLRAAEKIKPGDDDLKTEHAIVLGLIAEKERKQEQDSLRALAASEEKGKQYAKYLELAKKSEKEGNKKEALFFYKKSLEYNADSKEAKNAIAALNRSSTTKETSKPTGVAKNSIADIDRMNKKSPDFQSKLAQLFPEGKTVNKSSKGNKSITQVIIVKEGKGVEYQEIKYSWGGVYYFKNGDPTTKLIWDKATR